MFIYVARHAWAGSFGDPEWPDDSLRELEAEGAQRYARLLKKLSKRGFAPEVVATSPYARCRQTAELISLHTEYSPEVVELEALTPGSNFEELAVWSRRTESDSICWVGHAPDVSHLAGALMGSSTAGIRFAKGSVGAFQLHTDCQYSCAELYWLATAKILGV
jgi:phosphohistidine phosphatase